MKILYLTKGDHVDYQDDCLFIGLRELFGANVVDLNKRQHNYSSYSKKAVGKLYGMGMSVTRILEDIEIDRTDISSKIKNKYYDYIIYGSIWRCNDHITEIMRYYEPNKIIAIDGEDETNIHKFFGLGIQYFKRELVYSHKRLNPISFSIPTIKVNFNKNKNKDKAYITPLDRSTYIYDNEKDYYNDYNEARFGITVKKAGWDCMRHYEIMANGCIPYFLDIDNCPSNTMHDFPKDLCKEVNLQLKSKPPQIVYEEMIDKFEDHFFKNNTTIKVAEKFINKIK
jgi:hypothetical protein